MARTRRIEAARYRQVLGHFATGVTVVTAAPPGGPVGLAVNSFFSVSLDPALVAFCIARSSASRAGIIETGSFCVNILGEDQEDVSRRFAARGPGKFSGTGWRPADSGAPILSGVLAWIDCDVDTEHEAGDHTIVVGRVRDLEVVKEGRPLLFFRGGYGRFEP